jgi:NAD(P)H dehydrogenase (quinone)
MGVDVAALARTPEMAANLGLPVRAADYGRPETLAPALADIDTLMLVSGSELGARLRQHQNLIDAAKAAGARWIVYTSLLRADSSPIPLAPEHLGTERALAASGIPHTLLRNGWYLENYTAAIPGAPAGGALLGAAGDARISAAPRADYAAAAAAVLTGEGQEGKVYELAGDAAFTLPEFAAEVSRQSGREIPYRNLTETDYAAALTGFGFPERVAQAFAAYDTAAAAGALFDDGRQLSRLIGRPTGSLEAGIAAALASV